MKQCDENYLLPELIDYPHDWPELGENLMSNFDHEVNEDVADKLRTTQAVAVYPGWEFNAKCWWDGQNARYLAAVRRYGTLRGTYAAPTPQDLMRAISMEYGPD
jgi:hypothetical protein